MRPNDSISLVLTALLAFGAATKTGQEFQVEDALSIAPQENSVPAAHEQQPSFLKAIRDLVIDDHSEPSLRSEEDESSLEKRQRRPPARPRTSATSRRPAASSRAAPRPSNSVRASASSRASAPARPSAVSASARVSASSGGQSRPSASASASVRGSVSAPASAGSVRPSAQPSGLVSNSASASNLVSASASAESVEPSGSASVSVSAGSVEPSISASQVESASVAPSASATGALPRKSPCTSSRCGSSSLVCEVGNTPRSLSARFLPSFSLKARNSLQARFDDNSRAFAEIVSNVVDAVENGGTGNSFNVGLRSPAVFNSIAASNDQSTAQVVEYDTFLSSANRPDTNNDQEVSIIVPKLSGCIAVFIWSDVAVYAAHYWENEVSNANTFRTSVLNNLGPGLAVGGSQVIDGLAANANLFTNANGIVIASQQTKLNDAFVFGNQVTALKTELRRILPGLNFLPDVKYVGEDDGNFPRTATPQQLAGSRAAELRTGTAVAGNPNELFYSQLVQDHRPAHRGMAVFQYNKAQGVRVLVEAARVRRDTLARLPKGSA